MMKRICWMITATMTLAMLAVGTPRAFAGDGDDEKVDVKDLPKAVVDAVNTAQPGGTIVEAEKETKKDATVYEVDVKNNGKTFELKIDSTGKVLSSKEEKDDDDKKEKNEENEMKK